MNMEPQDQFRPDMSRDEVLTPFDVREHSGRAAMIKLFGAAAFLLIIAFVLLKVYQPGTRDRVEPPKIEADNTPFKIEPANKGGEQTPNQDKSVYNRIDGSGGTETVTTAPGAEDPITLPKSANIVVEMPDAVTEAVDEPVVKTPPTPKPAATQPATTKPSSAIGTGASDYVVQVASSRDRADAERLWTKITSKYGDVVPSTIYSDIKRADLGDKGIYYRLRLAGLQDKDAANQLCSRLKARGQACFVTK